MTTAFDRWIETAQTIGMQRIPAGKETRKSADKKIY